MSAPLIFVEVTSRDPRSTARFFESVLGWGITEVVAGEFYRAGTGCLPNVGITLGSDHTSAPAVLPYFLVDDVDDVARKVHDHGGRVLWRDRPLLDLGRSTGICDPLGSTVVVWVWEDGRGYDPRER